MLRLTGRARWAVPAGVVAVTGVVIGASAVASAAATPSLPSRTAAQLLAAVAQGSGKPAGPFSATIQETSDFGLPALPAAVQQAGGPSSLTAGSSTISIWYRDPQHVRVAEPVQAGETDFRLNGRTLWTWSSKTQTATRYALPAHFTGIGPAKMKAMTPHPGSSAGPSAGADIPATPQAAASQILTAVGPTTLVRVQRNIYVAGRAAYQLALVPRSSQSLVGSVLIAIDASRHIPLRVEVFPRGSSTVAYSLGFSSLTFGAPSATNFSFTPPPGARIKKVAVPANPSAVLRQAGLPAAGLGGLGPVPAIGMSGAPSAPLISGGKAAKLPAKVEARIKAQFAASLPTSMSKAQRAKVIRQFDQSLAKGPALAGLRAARAGKVSARLKALGSNGGGFFNLSPAAAAAGAAGPKVIGTSWLSVVATPPNPAVARAVQQLITRPQAQVRGSATYSGSSSSAAAGSPLSAIATPAGPYAAVLHELLAATRPVKGSWGHGRLLQTRLLTILVTSKGQILAGAVTPAALYADVARDAG